MPETSSGKAKTPEPLEHFLPMKSRSGIRSEFFNWYSLGEFWEKWAQERIEGGLVVEPKLDGFRATLHRRDGEVRIFLEEVDRDFSPSLPEVAAALQAIPHSFILDSELLSEADETTPVVFDLLWWKDQSLMDRPFVERRAALTEALAGSGLKVIPAVVVRTKEALLDAVKAAVEYPHSEGAMVKELGAPYLPGERSRAWAKVVQVRNLRVKVLEVAPVQGTLAFRYRCGVRLNPEDASAFPPDSIERGCVSVGWTLTTSVTAQPGDNLIVQVRSVDVTHAPDQGYALLWRVPIVVDTTPLAAFTLEELLEAAALLSDVPTASELLGRVTASTTEVWFEIQRIDAEANARTSVDQLSEWIGWLSYVVAAGALFIERRYARQVRERLRAILDAKIEKDVQALSREIAKLQENVRRCEQLIAEKEEQISALVAEINQRKTALAGIPREMRPVDWREVERLETLVRRYEGEIKGLQTEIQELFAEIDKKQAQILKLQRVRGSVELVERDKYPVRDGLYLVERHAELVAAGEKDLIVKSRRLDVAGRVLYLITEDRVLGEIELEAPRQITETEFRDLRKRHHITDRERELWWGKGGELWAYPVKAFKRFDPPLGYNYKPGVQTVQKDVRPTVKLRTKETRETEFNLVHRSWKGPHVVRGGRRGNEWIIMLPLSDRGYTGFHLRGSPLTEEELVAVRDRVDDEFWNFSGQIPAGHPANPLKRLPVTQVLLDRGPAIILEDSSTFLKVIFKGERLKGTWAFRKEEDQWVIEKSGGPGSKR